MTNQQKAMAAGITAQLPYLNANYLERISIHIEIYLTRQEEEHLMISQSKKNIRDEKTCTNLIK